MSSILTKPFTHAIRAKNKRGKEVTLLYLYMPQDQTLLPYQMGHLYRCLNRYGNEEVLVGEVQAPRQLKQSESYHAFITWIINDMNASEFVFQGFV